MTLNWANSFSFLYTFLVMILHTPMQIRRFFYFAYDTRARRGDEMLAISIGSLYFGAYPSETGINLSWGRLDDNEAL
jgi:hypothetical protein